MSAQQWMNVHHKAQTQTLTMAPVFANTFLDSDALGARATVKAVKAIVHDDPAFSVRLLYSVTRFAYFLI